MKVPVTPLLPSYLCLERYNLILHFYQLAEESALHTTLAPLDASVVQMTYSKVKHGV